jgi:formylglycine-generating enzyme required for sulfatase activity
MQASPSAAPAPVVDEYRIVRSLGRDGGGAVFLAHDRSLDRAVVLHVLPADIEAAAALVDAARALAGVSHPSLCRIHRIRESGPRPCIIQNFERGERLEAVARPMATRGALDVGRALAGAIAALHAAGVAHGDVRADRVILGRTGTPCLLGLRAARAAASPEALAKDVAALVAIVERIADPELRSSIARLGRGGPLTAEQLRDALDALARPSQGPETLAANPYRGLRPFEPEHASVFFGRKAEVDEALARMRREPWLLVVGPSGAGKSSLVRAGIGPAIAAGGLGERARWDVATLVPGPRPLSALAAALAPLFAREASELAAELRAHPAAAGRLARERTEAGLLLFVDQLEETMTIAEPAERDAFLDALSRFSALAPGVRAIVTLRTDFLDRLTGLGTFGRDLMRATFVLSPMRAEGLRHAIVGPARARGFEMETASMVDALAAEARTDAGTDALPLLSFVLAELWTERDAARRVLPQGALTRLGGAAAALARHGDTVLATLAAPERRAARRILLALVTASGTRARRTRAELTGPGGAGSDAALEALIRGRLVVAGETYEIAHEALVRAWPRLRAWLDEASDARAAAARLAAAASEWVRLGHGAGLLWSAKQLRDLEIAGALDGASDAARSFVAASRAAERRARLRRGALALGVPLAVIVAGASVWGVAAARHRAAVTRAVEAARSLDTRVAERARVAEAMRADALAVFEKDDLGPAERLWKQMLALEADIDGQRRDVEAAVAGALALDPGDRGARALAADVALARLLAAERLHEGALQRELRAKLDIYDDGSRAALLRAPARVLVESDPEATLTLARYREDATGRLVETDGRPLAAREEQSLEAGSYLIVAEAPGRAAARYPFLARRGEGRALRVVLARGVDVPEGMVYVPAGRSLYGSNDDEATREFFAHEPAHDVEVGAFLIARTEVTNLEYMGYLLALPASERKARLPAGLVLMEDGRIAWRLREKTLAPGEPYCNGAPCVDWLRLPVDGANQEDGARFAAWMAGSGRLPGARLCTGREWERAARGADDRLYPSGNGELGASDACTLASYGGDAARAGPCAAGTHPSSRSPFGVDDMAGSEWEWTSGAPDIAQPKQGAVRGAGWVDFGMYLSSANRGFTPVGARYSTYGVRLCADAR